jgi:hypothetical protein
MCDQAREIDEALPSACTHSKSTSQPLQAGGSAASGTLRHHRTRAHADEDDDDDDKEEEEAEEGHGGILRTVRQSNRIDEMWAAGERIIALSRAVNEKIAQASKAASSSSILGKLSLSIETVVGGGVLTALSLSFDPLL